MWCPACRADVAAELSNDSRHFQCARCRAELGTAAGALGTTLPAPASPTDAEKNARELLARWSAQNLLSPPPPLARPMIQTANPQPRVIEAASNEPPPQAPAVPEEPPRPRRKKKRRIDRSERRPQGTAMSDSANSPRGERAPNWGATVGQICAYFGIGLITCGTSIVLWGYFGGPTNYAPTGWLITTIGQMFLFLGVVTLISSGMEQTTSDVSEKIEQLGERLIRIESRQKRHKLAGPHEPHGSRRRGPASSGSDDLAAEPS